MLKVLKWESMEKSIQEEYNNSDKLCHMTCVDALDCDPDLRFWKDGSDWIKIMRQIKNSISRSIYYGSRAEMLSSFRMSHE